MCQGSLKKRHIIDAWQDYEYSSGSEYTRILNMPGWHKFLKKCCTIDAWQDYEYSQVMNMAGF